MPTTPPAPKKPRNAPLEDRRAAPGSKGPASSLRWVKGALGRPLGLERRGSQLHVVLVDRRRKPAAEQPLSISHMRAELQVRLLAHEFGKHCIGDETVHRFVDLSTSARERDAFATALAQRRQNPRIFGEARTAHTG